MIMSPCYGMRKKLVSSRDSSTVLLWRLLGSEHDATGTPVKLLPTSGWPALPPTVPDFTLRRPPFGRKPQFFTFIYLFIGDVHLPSLFGLFIGGAMIAGWLHVNAILSAGRRVAGIRDTLSPLSARQEPCRLCKSASWHQIVIVHRAWHSSLSSFPIR